MKESRIKPSAAEKRAGKLALLPADIHSESFERLTFASRWVEIVCAAVIDEARRLERRGGENKLRGETLHDLAPRLRAGLLAVDNRVVRRVGPDSIDKEGKRVVRMLSKRMPKVGDQLQANKVWKAHHLPTVRRVVAADARFAVISKRPLTIERVG